MRQVHIVLNQKTNKPRVYICKKSHCRPNWHYLCSRTSVSLNPMTQVKRSEEKWREVITCGYVSFTSKDFENFLLLQRHQFKRSNQICNKQPKEIPKAKTLHKSAVYLNHIVITMCTFVSKFLLIKIFSRKGVHTSFTSNDFETFLLQPKQHQPLGRPFWREKEIRLIRSSISERLICAILILMIT